MSRGRGRREDIGLRRQAPDASLDPIGFRAWWQNASATDKLSYKWPTNLDYTDLSHLDLNGVDLSGVSLYGANLSGCDLRGAELPPGLGESTVLAGAQLDSHSNKLPVETDPHTLLAAYNSDLQFKTKKNKDGETVSTWENSAGVMVNAEQIPSLPCGECDGRMKLVHHPHNSLNYQATHVCDNCANNALVLPRVIAYREDGVTPKEIISAVDGEARSPLTEEKDVDGLVHPEYARLIILEDDGITIKEIDYATLADGAPLLFLQDEDELSFEQSKVPVPLGIYTDGPSSPESAMALDGRNVNRVFLWSEKHGYSLEDQYRAIEGLLVDGPAVQSYKKQMQRVQDLIDQRGLIPNGYRVDHNEKKVGTPISVTMLMAGGKQIDFTDNRVEVKDKEGATLYEVVYDHEGMYEIEIYGIPKPPGTQHAGFVVRKDENGGVAYSYRERVLARFRQGKRVGVTHRFKDNINDRDKKAIKNVLDENGDLTWPYEFSAIDYSG
jgi:hypothetical protein